MRDVIQIVAAQLHEWFPDSKITVTRFFGNYEYGQFYIGELDVDVRKQLMDRHGVIRDLMIIYTQNPILDQTEVMAEFDRIRRKIEDFCCHVVPMWHHPYLDVFQGTLVVSFEIWERYKYVDDSVDKFDKLVTEYPLLGD